MSDEDDAIAAGWYKCAGGEWTKIIKMPEGEKQIAVSSARNALHYETTLAGFHWRGPCGLVCHSAIFKCPDCPAWQVKT